MGKFGAQGFPGRLTGRGHHRRAGFRPSTCFPGRSTGRCGYEAGRCFGRVLAEGLRPLPCAKLVVKHFLFSIVGGGPSAAERGNGMARIRDENRKTLVCVGTDV
ncbi:unnamed protein product [Symbiodinium sp. CCMP2592]|nr:unnamed protein product [Symbiodinium sp. CCMP2592]